MSSQNGFQTAAQPASHWLGDPFAQLEGSAQQALLNWSDIETCMRRRGSELYGPAGSELYGWVAVSCVGGWQRIVWAGWQ